MLIIDLPVARSLPRARLPTSLEESILRRRAPRFERKPCVRDDHKIVEICHETSASRPPQKVQQRVPSCECTDSRQQINGFLSLNGWRIDGVTDVSRLQLVEPNDESDRFRPDSIRK